MVAQASVPRTSIKILRNTSQRSKLFVNGVVAIEVIPISISITSNVKARGVASIISAGGTMQDGNHFTVSSIKGFIESIVLVMGSCLEDFVATRFTTIKVRITRYNYRFVGYGGEHDATIRSVTRSAGTVLENELPFQSGVARDRIIISTYLWCNGVDHGHASTIEISKTITTLTKIYLKTYEEVLIFVAVGCLISATSYRDHDIRSIGLFVWILWSQKHICRKTEKREIWIVPLTRLSGYTRLSERRSRWFIT